MYWAVVCMLANLSLALSWQPSPFDPPDTCQRAINRGYPCETHHIVTEDKYVLTAFRIPKGKHLDPRPNRGPVLLQHGLLCSSDCWVLSEEGLAFVLADAGYDVWLVNNRGTIYSRGHLYYSIKDEEFWNFSFHELGYYDLPAATDYVLEKTGEEDLIYVGHSQGTMIYFVMGSTRPEYHKKIKLASALAPIAYMNDTRGLNKALSGITPWLVETAGLFGVTHVLDRSVEIAVADRIICTLNLRMCYDALNLIVGLDSNHLDKELLPYFSDICPTGASIKQLIHYNQLTTNGGKFTWFDYGKKNKLIYKSTTPPEYDLSQIKIPTLLYYGPNDYITSPKNVAAINSKLPNVPLYKAISDYNHLDFLWGKDSYELLYDQMLEEFKKY